MRRFRRHAGLLHRRAAVARGWARTLLPGARRGVRAGVRGRRVVSRAARAVHGILDAARDSAQGARRVHPFLDHRAVGEADVRSLPAGQPVARGGDGAAPPRPVLEQGERRVHELHPPRGRRADERAAIHAEKELFRVGPRALFQDAGNSCGRRNPSRGGLRRNPGGPDTDVDRRGRARSDRVAHPRPRPVILPPRRRGPAQVPPPRAALQRVPRDRLPNRGWPRRAQHPRTSPTRHDRAGGRGRTPRGVLRRSRVRRAHVDHDRRPGSTRGDHVLLRHLPLVHVLRHRVHRVPSVAREDHARAELGGASPYLRPGPRAVLR